MNEEQHAQAVAGTLTGDEIRLRRLAMDAAGVGTWVHDLEANTTFGDDTAMALMQFANHYVPPEEFMEIILPEDRPVIEDAVKRAIESESGQYAIEYRIVWPDKSVHWISAKGEVIREGVGEEAHPVRIIGIVMDITARKSAESALRESQERLTFVIEASNTAIWDWNLATDTIVCSERWLTLFGLPPGTRMTKEVFLQAVHPDDRERVALAVENALKAPQPYEVELRTVWPDGTVHWVLKRGQTYFDHNLHPLRLLGAAFDITDIKKAETAIAESESLFKSIFKASLDPVILLDNQGLCLEVNRSALTLFGSIGLDVKGKCLLPLLCPDDVTPVWESFLKTGCYQKRHEIAPARSSNKLILDAYGIASVVKDRHLFVLHDVTERENLLREHESQRHFLDQVIDTVPAPVWISRDPQCLTMTGNKAAYRILHMPHGVNISESIRETDTTRTYAMARNGKPIPPHNLPMQRAARLNHEIFGEEFDIVYDDGNTLHMLGNAAPLHNEQGTVVGAVGVFMDITYRADYERHLKTLAQELERSNKDLEQFAYVVSHDLQEPLRQVVRFGEILHERYREEFDQAGKEFLDFIVDGGKRMQQLVKDLLAYSKVERGELQREVVPLQEVLVAAMENLKTSINSAGAIITHDEFPAVNIDRMQLVQVFQNLLGNAIKFRGKKPPLIHVGVKRDGRDWVFCVQDNGIGFDPAVAETIFELFRQLPTGAKQAGTGIGLAICKRVVESHGGRIWAESQPGKGSTFYFTIPAV